mgnify:CR=1 FL=1
MILLMRCAVFDLDNQRSIESLSAVKIVPLQIESGEDFSASVLDYLAASTRLVVDEPSRYLNFYRNCTLKVLVMPMNYGRLPSWKVFALRKRAWVVAALGHSRLQLF